MGYGSRAIDLLNLYFQGELSGAAGPAPALGVFGGEGSEELEDVAGAAEDMDDEAEVDVDSPELLRERIVPRGKLPALLTPLVDRPAERLHWLGVSFGLTSQLLNFWSRKGYKTCYLRQTHNELTGEHSAILLKELNYEGMSEAPKPQWLGAFVTDYQKRLVSLMSFSFSKLDTVLAISLLDPERVLTSTHDSDETAALMEQSNASSFGRGLAPLTASELLSVHLSYHDLTRLELYARNMVDHHMILDTVPILTRLLFLGRIHGVRLSYLQVAILLATGLQHRDVDSVAAELDIPVSQVLAFFNKTIRKIVTKLREMVEAHVSTELPSAAAVRLLEKKAVQMGSLNETLSKDQKNDAAEFNKQQREAIMASKDLSKHVVHANDNDLDEAMTSSLKKRKTLPSVVSVAAVVADEEKSSKSGESGGGDKKHKKHKHAHEGKKK